MLGLIFQPFHILSTMTLADPLVRALPNAVSVTEPQTRAEGTAKASPTDGAVLQLSDVRKRFEGVQAIDGVSFEVERGEILAVIGRSGAGKSTLIRCLNGLEKPDSGRIEVLGEDIAPLGERELRRVRLRIGMIFQHFNLLSSKTVADNVGLPLKIAGRRHGERRGRVSDLLSLVGLEDKAGAYPAELSGGQKQRVGIARALAAEPALLLSDEATSALDPETTASILSLLRDINRRLGLTIVLITHEMSVVRAIADRVVVLDRGRVVEQGAASSVFANPQAALTRRLIAAAHHGANGDDTRDLPDLASDWAPSAETFIRIALLAEAVSNPILADLTSATGARPVIRRAEQSPSGSGAAFVILFSLRARAFADIERIERYLVRAGAQVEVLGHARSPA